ncbi:MAG: hypothetical protein ABI777_08890, partial [Betaproteobacteria bacterium]
MFITMFAAMFTRRRALSRTLIRAAALMLLVSTAHAQTDADFLAAKAAFDKGDRARLAVLGPKLSSHLLAPYAEYWQLKLGIEDASPLAIRGYLDRYPNSPLADRLRAEWLKSLARKGLWDRFALDYAAIPGDDIDLACATIRFRWQRDGDDAIAAAKPLWFTAQSTPDNCEPIFAALIKRGDISLADRKARFRLATEAGNLRVALAVGSDLPGADRIADQDFNAVQKNPLPSLNQGAFAFGT